MSLRDNNRMIGPVSKLDRAEAHMHALRTEVERFLASAPFIIGCRRDAETRRAQHFLARVDPVPPSVATIMGDVLFNLRSALDQLAQAFYLFGSKTTVTARHVSFPIALSEVRFREILTACTNGMREDAIDFIASLKPWRGANDDLWQLHELNNIDKHRLLVTVGAALESADIGGLFHRDFVAMFEKWGKQPPPRLQIPVIPADKLCPLKGGEILFEDAPDAEPSEMEFKFSISLHEPTVLPPSAQIAPTLNRFGKLVQDVLVRADPLLR